jgi:hypothetical protein
MRSVLNICLLFILMQAGNPVLWAREVPGVVEKEYHFTASRDEPLFVRLEVDAGEIEIRPSGEDRDVYLTARYAERRLRLDVEFDDDDNELYVYFDVRKWLDDDRGRDTVARLVLELPVDVPIEIESRIKAGETDIELGGIFLRRLELKMLAGETIISFSEPNPGIAEEIYIDTKIGELSVKKLGNARFRYAAVDGSIGELSVDLSGDAEIDFDQELDLNLSLGETTLYVPEDSPVRLRVSKFLFFSAVDIPDEFDRHGKYYFLPAYEEADHGLEISVSPGLGSLDVRLKKSRDE